MILCSRLVGKSVFLLLDSSHTTSSPSRTVRMIYVVSTGNLHFVARRLQAAEAAPKPHTGMLSRRGMGASTIEAAE